MSPKTDTSGHYRPLALLLFAASACLPSAFDELPKRHEDAGEELEGGSTGSDTDDPADADTENADDEPLDAARESVSTADAGAGDDSGIDDAASDDAGCVSMARPLPASPRLTELARLARPSVFAWRVLGPSQRSGDGRIWSILMNERAADLSPLSDAPANHPLLAYDGPDKPWLRDSVAEASWRLTEQSTDSVRGATMLPLRSGESVGEVSLFPLSLISRPDGQPGALAFVLSARLFVPESVSLATIDAGEYTAVRASTPLFTKPPFFVHGARRDGEYVTLYACSDAPGPFDTNSCVAGRVHQDQIADPGAYQVRKQEPGGAWTWTSELEQGTPVLENVFQQLSVTYNDHLRAYLAVYGEKLSNHVVLRTARSAEGPWSFPVRVPLPAPRAGQNTDIREHASIVQRCESRILVSYFAPTRLLENGYPADGEAVLAAIDLQEDRHPP